MRKTKIFWDYVWYPSPTRAFRSESRASDEMLWVPYIWSQDSYLLAYDRSKNGKGKENETERNLKQYGYTETNRILNSDILN